MCFLCCKENPFNIQDHSKLSLENKKARAKEIKDLLSSYATISACEDGQAEVDKLKEEQYLLARDL